MLDFSEKFLTIIKDKNLFTKSDQLLLACSGGKDSMALLFLLKNADFKFTVAHCNFDLRGEESDLDEAFVKEICEKNKIKFISKKFNTLAFAAENKVSTQMAARELRYTWFKTIENIDFILTAHHLNDRIESLFLNITRGTGPKGLLGMPASTENIRRPLLYFSQEEILAFLNQNNIFWREDASNITTKYKRNALRHRVISELKKHNPNFEKTQAENFRKIELLLSNYNEGYDKFLKKEISRDFLKSEYKQDNIKRLYLEEYLKTLGFNSDQIKNAIDTAGTGVCFHAEDMELWIERDHLVLKQKSAKLEQIALKSLGSFSNGKISFQVKKIENRAFDFKNNKIGYFDFTVLNFPFQIRPWAQGDKIQPLGMKGIKKVSDILIDKKIEAKDKSQILVLEKDGVIYWVLGICVSERSKIQGHTREVLKISFGVID